MNIEPVLEQLNLTRHRNVLAPEWLLAQTELETGGLWLGKLWDQRWIQKACRELALPGTVIAKTATIAERIGGSVVLQALLKYCHYALYHSLNYQRQTVTRWPSLTHTLGTDGDLFYLIALVSGLPSLKTMYRQRGIPETVMRDTLADVRLWLDEHYERYGRWGLIGHRIGWLRNHFRGQLYRLGRLQFEQGVFGGNLRVFRSARRGIVIALSGAGIQYRRDGQINGAGGMVEEQGCWRSSLQITRREVRGNPILPTGRALPTTVVLRRSEWREMLAPQDQVLHIHVPAGEPMAFAACGQSLETALRFFPRYFPDRSFRAFCCGSWFLDSQFEKMLRPDSNIVRFQKEVYLFPILSTEQSALERVFGEVPEDLTRCPKDTSLRRAIIDHLLAGGHLRGGGCFLLPKDLSWGKQVYRHQDLEAVLPS